MTSQGVYKDYGLHYDQLWTPLPKSWQQARMRLIRQALPDLQSVCELGCGTARTAIEFARKGLRVYGVDLSAAMLKAARKKVRRAGLRVQLIHADMRSFRLPDPVDLICAEWGVVNHVPRKQDLLRVGKAVARALRPGGYFMFDINRQALFEEVWAGTDIRKTADYFHVQQGGWDARRRKGQVRMIWFVLGPGGKWRRFEQSAEQVHWSTAEVRQMLQRTGFEGIQAFDYMALTSKTRPPAKFRGLKTLFLARRK